MGVHAFFTLTLFHAFKLYALSLSLSTLSTDIRCRIARDARLCDRDPSLWSCRLAADWEDLHGISSPYRIQMRLDIALPDQATIQMLEIRTSALLLPVVQNS